MDNKKLIGSRIITTFNSNELDDTIISLIQDYHIGGIILNANNLINFSHAEALINLIKSYADYNILIGIDFFSFNETHEIYKKIYDITYPLALTSTNDADYIYKYADILSKNIKLLNANLDITINGNIPISNLKHSNFSFGSDLTTVSKYIKTYTETISEADIITTISDFPGIGNNKSNVINSSSISELLNKNIKPYKTAADSNVDIIFINDTIYENLEKDMPACLSKNMINLIKKELEESYFIIGSKPITDNIINKLTVEDIISKSFLAGVELLYIPNYYENLPKIIDNLSTKNKIIDTINQSQHKFDFLSKKLDFVTSIQNIDETEDVVLNTFSEQISEEAIAITKNSDFIPLQLQEFDIIGVVEPEKITKEYILEAQGSDIFSFSQYLKENHPSTYQVIPGEDTNWEDFNTVIYCIDKESAFTLDYLKKLEKLGTNIILVFTDNPEQYYYYKNINSVANIFTYNFTDAVRKGVSNILFGKYIPKSKFPLSL